jgi:crotonobetainyl-CoA:carnitine CoA-transferase CaiB-like acyl-CoA transferase
MTPLQDLRVLEWGQMISAAYCGRQLAEFGARVDTVEPPGGEVLRSYGPVPADETDPECSGLFIHLNSAKRSIVLDAQTPAGRATLLALIARADVFVTNQPLALRTRLGLDAASLRATFPRLLYVSLSVFGDSGPHADAPAQTLDAYAVSGCACVIGEPQREPLIVPLLQADYQAGAHAAAATLMALLARRRNPDAQAAQEGETIDIASADVLAAAAGTNAQIYLFHGTQRWERAGRRAFGSGGPYPYTILPCKDGAVCMIGRARQEWARLVDAMGTPEWTQQPRYQDLQAMGRDYPDEVDALVMPWLARHTRAELLKLAESFGFPLAPLRTMNEVAASPQFAHRGFFRDIPNARLGHVRVPGVPWQFAGQAPSGASPAPKLGEHTVAILDELEHPTR